MKSEEFIEIMKALNNLSDEIKENRKENNRRWEENDRRWEENNKRWEENDRRWEENDRRWKEIHADMERNKKDIENILWSFQYSIESMFENHETRIKRLESICS